MKCITLHPARKRARLLGRNLKKKNQAVFFDLFLETIFLLACVFC